MLTKKNFVLGILISLLTVNTCFAAVEFQISPNTRYVSPGETVSYDLTVSLAMPPDETISYPISEEFSIDPMKTGWAYSFSEDKVALDLARLTNSSVLEVTVPADAVAGPYTHTVIAKGYDSSGIMFGIPSEINTFVINTNVQVPEFPTVALPMFAVFGLVAMFGRKKNKL